VVKFRQVSIIAFAEIVLFINQFGDNNKEYLPYNKFVKKSKPLKMRHHKQKGEKK